MPKSPCVEISEQICDSLMGQGERASAERRIAAGHLQGVVGLSKEWWEKATDVSSC
jgi:hypothetical protein